MREKIATLVEWLNKSNEFHLAENVSINETQTSGRGLVLTEGELRKNDLIISIPDSHQMNYHTVLYHISKFNNKIKLQDVTIFEHDLEENDEQLRAKDPRYQAYGCLDQEFLLNLSSFQLLALYILTEWILLPLWSSGETGSFWRPFFDVWPTKEELKSIPALWNSTPASSYTHLLATLPLASKNHVSRISTSIKNDWEVISPVLNRWNTMFAKNSPNAPSIAEQYLDFLHIYFVINSRCLYAEIPMKKDDVANNFTMVPFVDFLNHTDEVDTHCYPKLAQHRKTLGSLGQFSIRCGSHKYNRVGEEIMLNYGAHSNDFLLNEYGFVLKENKWNFIDISGEVTSLMKDNSEMASFLKENGYWGDYTISMSEVSFRTVVALSLIVTLDYRKIKKFLLGYISEDYFLPKIKHVLHELLTPLLKNYQNAIKLLEDVCSANNDSLCAENVLTIYSGYIKIIDSIFLLY